VIQAALEAAATVPGHRVVGADLTTLRVVGRYTCGCDRVNFATDESLGRSVILADGIGQAPNGGTVGVLVWGTDEAVTGL
jgi:hypothetical protein